MNQTTATATDDFGTPVASHVAAALLTADAGDELILNDFVASLRVTSVHEYPSEGYDGRVSLNCKANGYDYVVTVDRWTCGVEVTRMASVRNASADIPIGFLGHLPGDIQ